jgi:hypothetical protein
VKMLTKNSNDDRFDVTKDALNLLHISSMYWLNDLFLVMKWISDAFIFYFAARKTRYKRLWWPVTSTRYGILFIGANV